MAIEFNVDQALAKLGDLIAKHGPQVVDFAAQVKRAEGVGAVATSAICAVVATYTIRAGFRAAVAGFKLHSRWSAYNNHRSYPHSYPDKQDRPSEPEGEAYVRSIGGLACLIVSTIFLIGAASELFDAWNWIAAFAPKLALAHDIMQRVTQ